MKKRRLIVNADDFGWGEKLTDKIIECHLNGIITSTTLMVNMPAAEYAAKRAPDVPEMSIGLHLNLTEGNPISSPDAVEDLLGENGEFPGNALQSKKLWRGSEYYKQVHSEVEAQVKRCIDLGVIPTHCDSHHGIHKMPVVQQAMMEIFPRYGINKVRTTLSRHRMRKDVSVFSALFPWFKQNLKRAPAIISHALSHYRLRRGGLLTPDWKATISMGVPTGQTAKEKLIATISAVPAGCSEILLHPGAYGPEDKPSEWHLKTWDEDTPICLDMDVIEFIKSSDIELISYRSL